MMVPHGAVLTIVRRVVIRMTAVVEFTAKQRDVSVGSFSVCVHRCMAMDLGRAGPAAARVFKHHSQDNPQGSLATRAHSVAGCLLPVLRHASVPPPPPPPLL